MLVTPCGRWPCLYSMFSYNTHIFNWNYFKFIYIYTLSVKNLLHSILSQFLLCLIIENI